MLTPSDVRAILDGHDQYWTGRRDDMRQLRALYMTRFWSDNQMDGILRVEVPRAYAVVESYLGSLYAKNPQVFVQPDVRARGNPEVAQATANQYLLTIREQVEDATRLALIYTSSAIKLAPSESVDPLKRVSTSALPPWEVVCDDTAPSWDSQRWVGHVYLMTLEEALQRYDKPEDEFRPRAYTRWIESTTIAGADAYVGMGSNPDAASHDRWVRVLELYDLAHDRLLVWSEDYDNGQSFLFEGIKVQTGALLDEDAETETVETTGIPFKSASGRPVVPIVPLYFSRDPDTPLRGYSLLRRSQSAFTELNVLRTYQAQGVRRMARQWLVRAGWLAEDAAAKMAQGLDGEFIEVDAQPGTPLEGNIIPVPNTPIPADISIYAQTVENDIRDAGLLAPFTRGEVSGSTATEQRLLQSYTSSEIGRYARIRDGMITEVARTYNIILAVTLGDDAEPLALPNPIGPTVLSSADLTGDFQYWAVDPGGTPLNDLAKQQALERLTPLLIQLGTSPADLLAELVRTYQLPESFTEVQPPPAAPAGPAGQPPAMTEEESI